MSAWQSALRKVTERMIPGFVGPIIQQHIIDWDRLVCIDFETYYDNDYTLKKLSTSEYVRDPRFKAQMLYLKIGRKPAKIIPPHRIKAELQKINWKTHSVLAHHNQFDGLILSHHYGVVPAFYYDSLSMARGLHSNEIGAGLDEVSMFYGGGGKLQGALEQTLGIRDWSPALFKATSPYCMNDGEEMLRVFKEMLPRMPDEEMVLIDRIVRMFCDPVLRVDRPRVEAELKRELDRRDVLMSSIVDVRKYDVEPGIKEILKKKVERELTGKDRDMLIVKRIIGSNERFAELLRDEGIDPPVKISPAWMKRSTAEREATPEDKWTYAFAKDDIEFANLPDSMERWLVKYDVENVKDVAKMAEKSTRLRALVDTRIAVKSTSNISRAERFLTASENGWCLPAYYAYSRAHTHRLGGGDKRNLQNLKRGGELRLCILAQLGYHLVVGDSGQIEARVNGWLWGQNDLLEAFKASDAGTGIDAYCRFATMIYGRPITKADKTERFVGKVCVLGLGFQMGAAKLQLTLAKGALGGPPVFFTLKRCQDIIATYRRANQRIQNGWTICTNIIEDMAAGRKGAHGPLQWEANTIWLPNGLALKYPDLRKAKSEQGWDEWTYANGDRRMKIYGGLLCENIVQALARIIVMSQLVELSRTYRIVLTTHDEIVMHVKKAQADVAFQRMMRAMTKPLDWCPDLPLAAEGGHAPEYSK